MPINSFLYPGAKFTPPYSVDNSCRFDDGSSAYMHKTPGSAGDQQKFTFSFWIKRCGITTGTAMTIFDTEADDDNQFKIRFNDNGTLTVESKVSDHNDSLITNQLFRDPSAWSNFVIAFDTTQGTASNRVKIYHNGTQITSFGTENYPAEDLNTLVNAANKLYVGTSAQTDAYCDMYIAEFCLVDGQQLAATSFGEFDSDSPRIWKPIDVSGLSFGTNGFYLDFEDSGNLGNDANGGTDLTEVNLAAIDQCVDSPTNNFATLNSLVPESTGTFSEGNCKNASSSSTNFGAVSTFGVSSGKWYAEFKPVTATGNKQRAIGVCGDITSNSGARADIYLYSFNTGGDSGSESINTFDGSSDTDVSSTYNGYFENDIVGVALDMDNNKVYFSVDGTWQNSADPASGTNGVSIGASPPDGVFYFAVMDVRNADVITYEANFGNPISSISSGNSDANGYGNFEYSVPSGYYSLCSKNLAEFGG